MVRNTVKNGQSGQNVCERSWRYLQPIGRKKDLISMYRGALISGNVNISVYFNKLANNF